MSLADEIFEVIKGAGTQFLKDIWQPDDLLQLKFIGEKLIVINNKLSNASTQEERDAYREDASQWVDQIKVLTLSRVNIGLQEIREKIESNLISVLLNGLFPYLGSIVSILQALHKSKENGTS